MKYSLSLLAVLIVFFVTKIQCQDDDIMSQTEEKVYCGRKLAFTLAKLCKNGLMLKRADMYNSIEYRPEPEYGWPRITHHRARSLERGKRQAASECCDKPCTLDELMTYCKP